MKTPQARRKVRVTLDLTAETNERLEQLTVHLGASSKADAIRTAVRLLNHLAQQHDKGYEFLQRKDGLVEVVPLFQIL